MSCNGCRVLRRGCNEECTLRQCLQGILSPDSQAVVTLFLTKFYGRDKLLKELIEACPQDRRPEIFGSLVYEACGRIVDPVRGSIGLLMSGNGGECLAAYEAIMSGSVPKIISMLEGYGGSANSHPTISKIFLALKAHERRKVKVTAHLKRLTTRQIDSKDSMVEHGHTTLSGSSTEAPEVNGSEPHTTFKFNHESKDDTFQLKLALGTSTSCYRSD
ncbi:hypothetical protein MLD38_004402 [Melastoma candidum]|uniref:Uncharacterized protein n=1 Tax=Melastoma candidum TaxID=119954 RepID=A0ACB9S7J5_9MYRT|nr:hypothetical protein MLD38_004402 [Melastoma candidum]